MEDDCLSTKVLRILVKGYHTFKGVCLLSVVPEGRNRSNGLKLQGSSLKPGTRENFLIVRAAWFWSSLPHAAMSSPSLKVFKQG